VNDQRADKEFEAFLTGESELADRYRELGREEPPPELDACILAEARNAAKVRRLRFGPRGGWLKPVALAATVLLSFSLVMNLVNESPVRYQQVVTESTETRARLNVEQAAKRPRAPETKRTMSNLPSAVVAEDRDIAVEERAPAIQEMRIQADTELVEMAMVARSEVRSIDRDAALLIVAEYVAAADMEAGTARTGAPAMERQAMREAEGARPAVRGLVATDRVTSAGDERQPDEDSDDDPESLLRDIERLNAGGSGAAAGTLLDAFLARYPDHPVSVKIRQQGY